MGRLGSLAVLESRGPVAEEADRRVVRREGFEQLRERLALLDREDRLLLKMHLEAGSTLDELAQVAGTSRSAVCRRLQRLIRRLGDETYDRCAQDRTSFSEPELAVIRDRFVRGLSLARIGRDHHLCHYRVRGIVQRAQRYAGPHEHASFGREKRDGDLRSEKAIPLAGSPE